MQKKRAKYAIIVEIDDFSCYQIVTNERWQEKRQNNTKQNNRCVTCILINTHQL